MGDLKKKKVDYENDIENLETDQSEVSGEEIIMKKFRKFLEEFYKIQKEKKSTNSEE